MAESPKSKNGHRLNIIDREQADDELRVPAYNGYSYQKLPTPTSIRLLELGPMQEGLPRTARMHIVDLNDNPEYTALSYTWGDRSVLTTCICDGHEVRITQNLGAFLRHHPGDGNPPRMWYEHGGQTSRFLSHLEEYSHTRPPGWKAQSTDPYRLDDAVEVLRSWPRLPKFPRWIWIDSLCINQSDSSEVSEQIPLMGRIFQNAGCVHVWLGEGDEDTTVSALRVLTLLSGLQWPYNHPGFGMNVSSSRWMPILNVAKAKMESILSDVPKWHMFLHEDLDEQDLRHFLQMLDHPWFARAWTYQESKLATRRVFSLGAYSFRTAHLQAALCSLGSLWFRPFDEKQRYSLQKHGMASVSTYLDFVNIDARLRAYVCRAANMLRNASGRDCCPEFEDKDQGLLREPVKLPLHKLLAERRGAQCTVKSDLVYSLLGLASDGDRMVPDPRYTWQDVFIQSVVPLIQTEHLDWVLHECGNQLECASLPSWVPDWRIKRPTRFWASVTEYGKYIEKLQSGVTLSPCHRKFYAQGYVEDDIDKVWDPTADGVDLHGTAFAPDDSQHQQAAVYLAKVIRLNKAIDARLFTTRRGQLGQGGSRMIRGDQIAVIWGLSRPLVIREKHEKSSSVAYRFVGHCYIWDFQKLGNPSGNQHEETPEQNEPIVPEEREEVTIVIE